MQRRNYIVIASCIFFIVAITSFFIGWVIVILISPITSTMSKYYEKTKANYSRDIDYLLSYTKNGLWIKENLKNKQRIITAKKPEGYKLIDVKIFHYDDDSFLFEKIVIMCWCTKQPKTKRGKLISSHTT